MGEGGESEGEKGRRQEQGREREGSKKMYREEIYRAGRRERRTVYRHNTFSAPNSAMLALYMGYCGMGIITPQGREGCMHM